MSEAATTTSAPTLEVTFYRCPEWQDEVAGKIRYSDGAFALEPEDSLMLRNILAHPISDKQSRQLIGSQDSPEAFLRNLRYTYRSAYLRASEAREEGGGDKESPRDEHGRPIEPKTKGVTVPFRKAASAATGMPKADSSTSGTATADPAHPTDQPYEASPGHWRVNIEDSQGHLHNTWAADPNAQRDEHGNAKAPSKTDQTLPSPVERDPSGKQEPAPDRDEHGRQKQPSDRSGAQQVSAGKNASADQNGRHTGMQRIHDSLASSNLPDAKKKAYGAALDRVSARMPQTVLDAIQKGNDGGTEFYGDNKTLGLAVLDGALENSFISDEYREKLTAQREGVAKGAVNVAGCYNNSNGKLHLDGSNEKAFYGRYGYFAGSLEDEVYAHEFGHALDSSEGKHAVSGSEEWGNIFQEEFIDKSKDLGEYSASLTSYANTSPSEALAEFSRLLYGSQISMNEVQREFPKATEFFKQKGWILGDKAEIPEESAGFTKPPDIFSVDGRIALRPDTNDHIDVLKDTAQVMDAVAPEALQEAVTAAHDEAVQTTAGPYFQAVQNGQPIPNSDKNPEWAEAKLQEKVNRGEIKSQEDMNKAVVEVTRPELVKESASAGKQPQKPNTLRWRKDGNSIKVKVKLNANMGEHHKKALQGIAEQIKAMKGKDGKSLSHEQKLKLFQQAYHAVRLMDDTAAQKFVARGGKANIKPKKKSLEMGVGSPEADIDFDLGDAEGGEDEHQERDEHGRAREQSSGDALADLLTKRLASQLAKSSFFANCDRDEHGRCLPQGISVSHQSGEEPVRKPEDVANAAFGGVVGHLMDYAGYRVFIIDAKTLRDLNIDDEEFGIEAIRSDFPDLIPENAIWISDRLPEEELPFVLDKAVTRKRAENKGVSGPEAYERGLKKEKAEREKASGIEMHAGGDVPDNIYVSHYATLQDDGSGTADNPAKPINIYLVDGEVVRDRFKTDWLEGGNPAVYPWQPNGEIWIEADTEPDEIPLIALHEYAEYLLMKHHQKTYAQAHALANAVEFSHRPVFSKEELEALTPAIIENATGENKEEHHEASEEEHVLEQKSILPATCPICGAATLEMTDGDGRRCSREACEWAEVGVVGEKKAIDTLARWRKSCERNEQGDQNRYHDTETGYPCSPNGQSQPATPQAASQQSAQPTQTPPASADQRDEHGRQIEQKKPPEESPESDQKIDPAKVQHGGYVQDIGKVDGGAQGNVSVRLAEGNLDGKPVYGWAAFYDDGQLAAQGQWGDSKDQALADGEQYAGKQKPAAPAEVTPEIKPEVPQQPAPEPVAPATTQTTKADATLDAVDAADKHLVDGQDKRHEAAQRFNELKTAYSQSQASASEITAAAQNYADALVSSYDGAIEKLREVDAHAELTPLGKASTKYGVALQQALSKFTERAASEEEASKALDEVRAAEPEAPIIPDEPQPPDEPEYPDEPEENTPEWQSWQKEVARLDRDHENASKEFDKTYAKWEKNSTKLQDNYERAFAKWEATFERADSRNDKAGERYEDALGAFESAAVDYDETMFETISKVSESLRDKFAILEDEEPSSEEKSLARFDERDPHGRPITKSCERKNGWQATEDDPMDRDEHGNLKTLDPLILYRKAATTPRREGEVWQGPSGRWFTLNDSGRVVPARNPNASAEGSSRRTTAAEPAEPPAPRPEAVRDEHGNVRGFSENRDAAGRRICYSSNNRIACGKIPVDAQIHGVESPQQLAQRITRELQSGRFDTPAKLAAAFNGLTRPQITAVKKELAVRASGGRKAEYAERIAQRTLAKYTNQRQAAQATPALTPAPEEFPIPRPEAAGASSPASWGPEDESPAPDPDTIGSIVDAAGAMQATVRIATEHNSQGEPVYRWQVFDDTGRMRMQAHWGDRDRDAVVVAAEEELERLQARQRDIIDPANASRAAGTTPAPTDNRMPARPVQPAAPAQRPVPARPAQARRDTEKEADEIFGQMDDKTVIKIIGVPEGASIDYKRKGEDYSLDGHGIRVQISHPKLNGCSRFLGVDKKGKKFIHNNLLVIKEEYRAGGLGFEIFSGEVKNGADHGFDYIATHAAGSFSLRKGDFNGYYTWPRFGYDQKIDKFDYNTKNKIKQRFPDAKSVLDIMAMPDVTHYINDVEAERVRKNCADKDRQLGKPVKDRTVILGSDWWLSEGSDMTQAEFDLTEGSRSRKVLEAYMASSRRAA